MHPLAPPLIDWYRENARDLPWRDPDFGAWGILVSEFMLQQTPVTRVIPRLEEWLMRWPTPAHLAAAPVADAVRAWANLGYPRRAMWLHQAAVEITARHGGVIPRDVDALLALPGIGDYTARAVAAFAYGERVPVVDTNTRRVLARAIEGKSQPGPAAKRDLAVMAEILPAEPIAAAIVNAAAMELGAVVCTARSARCELCPLASLCAWRAAGYPDTGDTRPKQAKYEGSDRQARGAVLAELRAADGSGVLVDALVTHWPDSDQRDRAILTLLADGLIETVGDMARLAGDGRSTARAGATIDV